jgi:hypothetical protein
MSDSIWERWLPFSSTKLTTMKQYTTWCLLKGDSGGTAFDVIINNNDTVSNLKKKINYKLPTPKKVEQPSELKLWLVNVPDNWQNLKKFVPEENAVDLQTFVPRENAVEMSPQRNLSFYFPNSPLPFLIHIIVQLPQGAQGATARNIIF